MAGGNIWVQRKRFTDLGYEDLTSEENEVLMQQNGFVLTELEQ